MKIIYTIEIDEKKLDEWTRELYGDHLDDPVPGEPKPGLKTARDWIAEAQASVAEGYGADTAWWGYTKGRAAFIDSIDIRIE